MEKDVELYFLERYKKADFRVVPGHWPDFKTRAEADEWIEEMKGFSRFVDFLVKAG